MFTEVEIGKAFLSLAVIVITLLLTWLLGQRLIVKWNIKQKQGEMDLQILLDITRLYGEFLEILRIWRYQLKTCAQVDIGTQDLLLAKAANAEGRVEAILSYIVSEKFLCDEDARRLGIFRQSCQVFRESIRNNIPMDYTYASKEMVVFRQTYLFVLEIIKRPRPYCEIFLENRTHKLSIIVNTSRNDYIKFLDTTYPANLCPGESASSPTKKI